MYVLRQLYRVYYMPFFHNSKGIYHTSDVTSDTVVAVDDPLQSGWHRRICGQYPVSVERKYSYAMKQNCLTIRRMDEIYQPHNISNSCPAQEIFLTCGQ